MLRIGDWIKFYPVFPLAGALCACGIAPELIPVLIIFMCITGYGFVVNNFYDVEIDRSHTGKVEKNTNPLVNGTVSREGTLVLMAVLVALPLCIAAVMSVAGLIFCLICIGALTVYSAPPFRFKDRFLVDILTHGLMFGGLPVLAGYALAGGTLASPDPLLAGCALIGTLVCFEALVAHQICDYWEDRDSATTTVVHLGHRMGGILLGSMMAVSIAALELVALAVPLDTLLHAGVLVTLAAYPALSCRQEVMVQMKSTYSRVLVACMNLQR
ncbi:MAG: UbiA prenyltransferase family protein [Methanomicrobiaceae archaeon]|nr:UbiA prenyltransferase family protein [Methanomicrobiaceae archaeon]